MVRERVDTLKGRVNLLNLLSSQVLSLWIIVGTMRVNTQQRIFPRRKPDPNRKTLGKNVIVVRSKPTTIALAAGVTFAIH